MGEYFDLSLNHSLNHNLNSRKTLQNRQINHNHHLNLNKAEECWIRITKGRE